jgi:hypothetical protein
MPWISLVALEVSPLHCRNIAEQNTTVKLNLIVKQSCSQEWQVVTSTTLSSGMILQHSTQENWEPSTLLSVASRDHARTLALQEMERAWRESEVGYFSRSCDLSEKYSQPLFSWRTPLNSELEDLIPSSKNLPKQGMMCDGRVYEVQMWERNTIEKECFYWPTPKASDSKRNDSPCERKRNSPDLTCTLNMKYGVKNHTINLIWLEWLMGYPSGHTELKPWAMQLFLARRKKRSKS